MSVDRVGAEKQFLCDRSRCQTVTNQTKDFVLAIAQPLSRFLFDRGIAERGGDQACL